MFIVFFILIFFIFLLATKAFYYKSMEKISARHSASAFATYTHGRCDCWFRRS